MTPDQIKALAKMNKPCKFKSGSCIYCNDTKKTAKTNKCGGWNVPDPTVFDISRAQLSQQIGEMTAQEWRTVQAALAVVSSNYKKELGQLSSEAERAEPVAFQFQGGDGEWCQFINQQHYINTVADGLCPIRALYLAPPAQPAKPLTTEQWGAIALEVGCDADYDDPVLVGKLVRAIEAAHGIKEQP